MIRRFFRWAVTPIREIAEARRNSDAAHAALSASLVRLEEASNLLSEARQRRVDAEIELWYELAKGWGE